MLEQPLAHHSRTNLFFRLLAVMIAIAAAVLFVRHFGDLQRFLELARRARPVWLLLAIALQVGTYVAVASGWRTVLWFAGSPLPLRRLLPVAMSKLFADQALPGAGLSGNVLLVNRLTTLGSPRGSAMAALLISMVGYYASYALLALAMLVILWLQQAATPLLTGIITTLLLVAVAIPSLALWLRHRGSRPLPPKVEQLGPVRKLIAIIGEAPAELVGNRRLVAIVTGLNGLVFIADATTLAFCLVAIGLPFLPATAFLGLMAGSIAATLAPVPLGLGTFEASATGMLVALHVPFEAALTAVLLLRGLTLWLPLVPGLFMLRSGPRPADDRR